MRQQETTDTRCSSFETDPKRLTEVQRGVLLLDVVVQVGGPQRVDGRGPHAHQDLSDDEQRHVQVVLVALLVAGTGSHVDAAAGVAGQAEALVAEGRVHLLDLVGRGDEVGQGEEGGAHGNEDAAHRQPARPLAPPAEVADEHDHQEAPDVEAADEEARLGAPQAVALLDGGDDAAEVAGHHERLDERQVAHAEQEAAGVLDENVEVLPAGQTYPSQPGGEDPRLLPPRHVFTPAGLRVLRVRDRPVQRRLPRLGLVGRSRRGLLRPEALGLGEFGALLRRRGRGAGQRRFLLRRLFVQDGQTFAFEVRARLLLLEGLGQLRFLAVGHHVQSNLPFRRQVNK